jgi:hypothetical protein
MKMHSARSYLLVALCAAAASVLVYSKVQAQTSKAQAQTLSPGSEPFVPRRIDWLTTTLQASLRTDATETEGYDLEIASPDPETILIYVRHSPTVNRQAMNITLDATRKVIDITAKSYGWDSWLKVREDIQLAKTR